MTIEVTQQHQNKLEEYVRRAGAKLLEFWPGNEKLLDKRDLKVEAKGDGSPVTAADLASNEILVNCLKTLWPGDGILSEEIPDRTDLTSKQRVWIIDPLDGTRSFVSGNDDFSILLALAIEGQVSFGMMYFPVKDILACAQRGAGSLINGFKGNVSSHKEFAPQSVYYRNFDPSPGSHLFQGWMDSGMAFLALSRGEIDGIIIKMTSHKEWDIAAPIAVVEESGGKITDEKGQEILFLTNEMNIKYVVASNGVLHDKLLSLLA